MKTLAFIQRSFPDVDEVVDSAKSIRIRVTRLDIKGGHKKDPTACALARACVREDHADGAIIGIGYSYLIKGHKATRFKTPATTTREIVSFDRSKKFEPGHDYLLSKVAPTSRLGAKPSGPGGKKTAPVKSRQVHVHHTKNIRVMR